MKDYQQFEKLFQAAANEKTTERNRLPPIDKLNFCKSNSFNRQSNSAISKYMMEDDISIETLEEDDDETTIEDFSCDERGSKHLTFPALKLSSNSSRTASSIIRTPTNKSSSLPNVVMRMRILSPTDCSRKERAPQAVLKELYHRKYLEDSLSSYYH